MCLSFPVVLAHARTQHTETTTSGGLTGVVTDQSSGVVPSADVEIKDSGKGGSQTLDDCYVSAQQSKIPNIEGFCDSDEGVGGRLRFAGSPVLTRKPGCAKYRIIPWVD
jgi:hypothetical protein